MKTWMFILFTLVLTLGSIGTSAQESANTPTAEEQQKDDAEKEKRAFALLDQVVDEAQLLRLPENRIRVQIGAAELLWQSNEGRARSLFSQAADAVAEMLRNTNVEMPIGERRSFLQTRTPNQLRQELVLTVARFDAPLAYQLLAATRQPAPVADLSANGAPSEDSLEQRLLAQVAALDPKLALQNAEQLLEKGKFPQSLVDVLAQLQAKDKEAAVKLEEKLLKRLASANMLTTSEAGSLALNLLQPGPRPATASAAGTSVSRAQGYLGQSAYADLMGTVIDAALQATPQSATNQPRQNRGRGRGEGGRGTIGGGSQPSTSTAQTPAETEQNNARRLLGGLQMLLPQVDQSVPNRAPAVRQKIAELGMNNSQRANMNQIMNGLQKNTSEGLIAAAALAPAGIQSGIYRQAALKALDEGNVDRARQIVNEHLAGSARESVMQALEIQQATKNAKTDSIDEVRRMLSGLANDDQRIDLLLQLAARAQPDNPKLAVRLLDEARQYTNKRASSYQQLEQQLRVADAFKDLEPDRSFEVLEPGIMQLNELLAAAATLSGFEVNVFREGEMPLQGGNGLSNMVVRYGQRLGALATKDFERSQTLANRFQMAEPRIVARLSIVRGMLGLEPAANSGGRRVRQDAFLRRGQ